MAKAFKTGQWILANVDLINSKSEVIVPANEPARIMVYDPSKEPTPYGLRTVDGCVTQIYVTEASIRTDPARVHEIPPGD